MTQGTGTGASLFFNRPAAGKTGTTDDHGRLVLRLHADPLDDRLGRVSAGADPDGERARDLGRRRHLPPRSGTSSCGRRSATRSPSSSPSPHRSPSGGSSSAPSTRTTTTAIPAAPHPSPEPPPPTRSRPAAFAASRRRRRHPRRPTTSSRSDLRAAVRAAALVAPLYLSAATPEVSFAAGSTDVGSTGSTRRDSSTDGCPTRRLRRVPPGAFVVLTPPALLPEEAYRHALRC